MNWIFIIASCVGVLLAVNIIIWLRYTTDVFTVLRESDFEKLKQIKEDYGIILNPKKAAFLQMYYLNEIQFPLGIATLIFGCPYVLFIQHRLGKEDKYKQKYL